MRGCMVSQLLFTLFYHFYYSALIDGFIFMFIFPEVVPMCF